MPDHRKTLVELYNKYNPEKVKEVDFLLMRFKGREEELIQNIQKKYGVTNVVSPTLEPVAPISPPAKSKKIPLMIGGGVLLAVVAVIIIWKWPKEPAKDIRYVIASSVYAHNAPDTGPSSRTKKIPFREEVEILGRQGDYFMTELDGEKSYIPVIYLAEKTEFEEIVSLYANDEAQIDIDDSYEKRALRDFFVGYNIMGEMSAEKQEKLYGEVRDKEVWQVFGVPEGAEYRASASGKFVGGEYYQKKKRKLDRRPDDFAVIIQKKDAPTKRKLLLFSFDPGLNKNHHKYPSLDISKFEGFLIRNYEYNDPANLRFEQNAQNKLSKNKSGILIAVPQSDIPASLIVMESEELKIYPEKEVYQREW